MTNETRQTIDEMLIDEAVMRDERVPKNFSVIRYGIKVHSLSDRTPVGLYGTLPEAQLAARQDNRTRGKSDGGRTKAVPVDMTDRIIKWAEDISYAARNPKVDIARTQKSILELVQFAMRGY